MLNFDYESLEFGVPHEVAELMCVKCLKRWIGVYPANLLLKEIECQCGETGYVIKTGQSIEESEESDADSN